MALRRRAAALLAVALAAAAGAGCHARPPLGRFIEAEPGDDLDFASIRKTVPVLDWQYASGGEQGRSPASCVPGCDAKEAGLELPAGEVPATVEWEAGWRADELATIELTVARQAQPGPGPVTLSWDASEGGRRWTGAYTARPAPGTGRYQLDVRLHHDWHGTIERVRFSWRSGRGVRVTRLRADQIAVRADWFAAIAARPVRVALSHDVRPALVAWPGIPVRRRGTVPAGAVLRFGAGVTQHVYANVRFRVRAIRGWRSEVLWERSVLQARGEAGRWFDAEVDLSRFSGSDVELAFETAAEPGLDPAWGLAFWADPDVVGSSVDARPDVVLVSVDTLRADRLGSYGSARGLTPVLDAWAAGATVYRQAVTAAPWTLPAHVSMLTGLDATSHGMNAEVRAPFRAEPLAERLRREGYATYAFTGGAFLHPDFGFARGFDRFSFWEGDVERRLETELRPHVKGLEAVLRARPRRPVFAFLHTYVVHAPLRFRGEPEEGAAQALLGPGIPAARALLTYVKGEALPEDGFERSSRTVEVLADGNRRELGPDEIGRSLVRTGYDSGVRGMDREIGPMLHAVSRSGALAILTSDHGESLGEHGLFGHGHLTDDNLLVPLVIARGGGGGSSGSSGVVVGEQVRSIDIVPTVLDVLGLVPTRRLDGVSLLPAARGLTGTVPREAWSYSAGVNRGLSLRFAGKRKYLFRDTALALLHGPAGAFDLEADPGEESALAESEESRAMARLAREKVRASAGGILDLQLVNDGTGQLEVELTGPLANPRRVKMLGEGCSCVSAPEPGTLRSVLRPGERVEVRFLGDASDVGILRASRRLGTEVVEAPALRLRPVEMEAPRSLELGAQGWVSRSGRGTADVRIVAVPGRLAARSSGRPETAEQVKGLRDLGYLQ